MIAIEEDIRGIPDVLRQTYHRVDERRDVLARLLGGPLVLLGCGSSYCVAMAAAATYEQERQAPTHAVLASDYLPRPDWTHVAISRTGQTTEVVEAVRRARRAGARVLLVTGEGGSPAEPHTDGTLLLDFAAEQGVIQTRFVAASVEALRSLATGRTFPDLARRVEQGLAAFDPAPRVHFDHVVFLGRGAQYGLARAAALNLQETALLVPEAHQTLDYRHGPIAAADEHTLVWCFDPPDAESAAVLDDVRKTGATVCDTPDDPLVALVQAQLLSVRMATTRGLDPTAPRNLARAVVFDR